MEGLKFNMSIYSLLNQIKSKEVVLPAIQRDFVWSEDKVVKLLDSVMRGYPIGIALLWETYDDVQYRYFAENYQSGIKHEFSDNNKKRKLKIVLDGQQRLQSLYIALYGRMEGHSLYFDLLSGKETDELSEDKFQFKFGSQQSIEESSGSGSQTAYYKVADLFSMKAVDQQKLTKKLNSDMSLSDADEIRLSLNLARFNEAFSKDENILRVLTIDENLPEDSEDRKSEADVLEIFVRINRQGTALSRSDLIFSLLKLNWKESAEGLPDFVESVNEGNSLDIDNDFVIRCLLAVSEFGTKFDIEQLRNKQKIEKLKSNFEPCCDAIRAAVDFATQECKCESAALMGGLNHLVPFVYYLFNTKKHEIKNSQLLSVKKSFYLLAFARPFSRYGDSRLWAFIKSELVPLAEEQDETFPFKRLIDRIKQWEHIESFDERLVQSNYLLALHVLQGFSGAQVQYVRNTPHIDHIFPRSTLREKDFDESEINHFANFWILAQGKNQNKTNTPPSQYFADVSASVMKKALINPSILKYGQFRSFLKQRKMAMVEKLKTDLEFTDSDFDLS
jgi:uncharacterized protein with ParB-like and HNH nuclease domain